MRRSDREVTNPEEILNIIDKCMVCRLGLWDGEKVYLVPMNFGYTCEDGVLNLYFHGADSGRKYDILSVHPQVGFEMDCEHGLDAGDAACSYGYYFASVVGNGVAEIVTDKEEKKKALSVLMQHQTGNQFSFDDRQAAAVTVLKVTAKEYSCKRRAKEK